MCFQALQKWKSIGKIERKIGEISSISPPISPILQPKLAKFYYNYALFILRYL